MTAAIQVSHHPAPATTPPAGITGAPVSVAQLRRFQWAVRATLAIGVAASVCANVLNARDNPISQAIAAWPPLALLLTVELVSRVPVHRRLLAIARIGGTAVIAGIAAYVSYFHMAAVVSRYGEHPPNPYLLPLSVDGLIVVASVSLVELSGRVRAALDQQTRYGVQPAPDEQATASVDVVPIRGTAPSGSGPAPIAEDNGGRHAPEPTPQAEPVNGAKSSVGSHNGHKVSDPGGKPPSMPLAPQPSHAGPAQAAASVSLTPDSDGAPESDAAPNLDADPDLVALLPAARAARDELLHQGRSLSRDSLARQLRRRGHTIRTARVSDLLTLLKNDTTQPSNGHQPHRADNHDDPP